MAVVGLGAFGAHALEARLSVDRLEIWQTAVQYHFGHTLALLLIGVLALQRPPSARLAWAARLMQAGIVLFSGSLYALALTDVGWLGAITPLGGVSFLGGWLLVSLAAVESPSR